MDGAFIRRSMLFFSMLWLSNATALYITLMTSAEPLGTRWREANALSSEMSCVIRSITEIICFRFCSTCGYISFFSIMRALSVSAWMAANGWFCSWAISVAICPSAASLLDSASSLRVICNTCSAWLRSFISWSNFWLINSRADVRSLTCFSNVSFASVNNCCVWDRILQYLINNKNSR